MGNTFGLGLVLSFTDNASVALGRVTNTISTLEATARGASSVLDSLGASMDALGSIGSTMSALLTTPITGFLGKITEWGVQRASSVQQLQIAFETLMGSAKGASDYLDKVMDYAKTTPYAFDDLAQIAQQLISFGMDANLVLDQTGDKFGGLMQALGDWSGASATGVQGMSEIAYALAQASAVGKVDGNILDRLSMRGLRAAKIIGNLHGMTEDAATQYIKTQMTAEEFIQDLIKGIEEGTDGINGKTAVMAGMVEKIKGTWVGAQDSFKSALKNAGLSLMGMYKDEDDITHYKFLESMTTSLNNISSAIKNISTILQPLMDIIENVMLKVSEAVKNIAQYYADLDDETKKHLGNVIAVITLMGPALIVFSRFGTMILKTIGFIKTFTTSMGTMSLILTTILFGIGTNFDGTRKKAEAFFRDISEGVSTAIKAVNEGVEGVQKVLTDLDHSKFYMTFTKRLMQVIGVIKAVASAWEDGFVDNDLWDLMNALGITPFVEAILNLKYNIQNFFEGFRIGFNNVISEAESFMGKLVTIFENSPLAPIFKLIQDMLHSWIEAGKGDYFKDLGERFANMLPTILAVITGLKAFGGVGGVFRTVTSAVGGLFRTLTGMGGGLLASVFGGFSPSGGGSGGILNGLMNSLLDNARTNARETIATEFKDLFGDVAMDDKENALSNFIQKAIDEGFTTSEEEARKKGLICFEKFQEGYEQAGKLTKLDVLKGAFENPLGALQDITQLIGGKLAGSIKLITSLLASPLGIVMAIIALIGVMYATNENFRESMNQLFGAIFEIIGVVIEALKPVFDVVKQIFAVAMQLIQVLAEILAPVVKLIAGIIHALAPVLKVWLDYIMIPIKVIASILKVIADLLSLFVGFIGKIKDAIMEKIQPVVDWLAPIIKSVSNFFDKLHNWLNGRGWHTTKSLELTAEPSNKAVNKDTTMGWGEILNLGGQSENAFQSAEEQQQAKSSSFSLSDLLPSSNGEAKPAQTSTGDTNNSIVFNKDSIVIQIAQATVEEAEILAERVIAIVKQRLENNSMASYDSNKIQMSQDMTTMLA